MNRRIILVAAFFVVAPCHAQHHGIYVTGGYSTFLAERDRYNHDIGSLGVAYSYDVIPWLTAEVLFDYQRSNKTNPERIAVGTVAWRDRAHTSMGVTFWAGKRVPLTGRLSQKFGPVLGPVVRIRRDELPIDFLGFYSPNNREEQAEADRLEQELRAELADNEEIRIHRFTYEAQVDANAFVEATGIGITEKARSTDIGLLAGVRYEISYNHLAAGAQFAYRNFLFESYDHFQNNAFDLTFRLGYRF